MNFDVGSSILLDFWWFFDVWIMVSIVKLAWVNKLISLRFSIYLSHHKKQFKYSHHHVKGYFSKLLEFATFQQNRKASGNTIQICTVHGGSILLEWYISQIIIKHIYKKFHNNKKQNSLTLVWSSKRVSKGFSHMGGCLVTSEEKEGLQRR